LKAADEDEHAMQWLRGKKVVVVSGIGDPGSFEKQVARWGEVVGCVRRGDHAGYSSKDVKMLDEEAKKLGAEVMVTTQKDWGKMRSAGGAEMKTAVVRVELVLRFGEGDEEKLFDQIRKRVADAKTVPSP
jgi:tetraacyldisaccharide 4'-kinase